MEEVKIHYQEYLISKFNDILMPLIISEKEEISIIQEAFMAYIRCIEKEFKAFFNIEINDADKEMYPNAPRILYKPQAGFEELFGLAGELTFFVHELPDKVEAISSLKKSIRELSDKNRLLAISKVLEL